MAQALAARAACGGAPSRSPTRYKASFDAHYIAWKAHTHLVRMKLLWEERQRTREEKLTLKQQHLPKKTKPSFGRSFVKRK